MTCQKFRYFGLVISFALIATWAEPGIAETPLAKDYYSEEKNYPSASQCANCHQQIYNEWASSSHAYASISPMFHKFEQKITDLTRGTIGSFCVRCHQQVGTQMGEARETPLWERSAISREGITCITCHRMQEEFAKVNGEREVVPADIHAPVAGTLRGSVFDKIIERADELKIATSSDSRGTPIHAGVYKFEQLGKSEFCVSCHQVAVNLGIKLEVVWDQYRASPSFKKGETCQDCHMGKVPGRAEGYERGPSAIVNGTPINPNRRHSNHAFFGPGYPIAHPGIFPHNTEAKRWTILEWLKFDHRAGWGSEKFEDEVADIAQAIDDIHFSLEALGGGRETLAALAKLDEAASRGVLAFKNERGIKRYKSALDNLDGAVDPDSLDGAVEEINSALAELRPIAEDFKSETALPAIERFGSSIKKMLLTAVKTAPQYEGSYENLQSASEIVAASPSVEAHEKFSEAVSALRAAMPAADNTFQSRLTEIKVALGVNFPAVWADVGDREEAREIISVNEGRIEEKRELRRQVMENGMRIDGPFFSSDLKVGQDLAFNYTITNTDEGHNLPSGSLGAQPELWFNVALVDPEGITVWESGYVDGNGDFADVHSLEVASGEVAHDDQLFNLQSKFLTTNVKGTDREMYLPVNMDVDQLPLLRPSNVPTTVLNHPPFARMEGRSLPPLASRDAEYKIPGKLLKKPGKYRLASRMRSRAEPIYFMRFVEATTEMERAMNEWMLDIHPYTIEFEIQK